MRTQLVLTTCAAVLIGAPAVIAAESAAQQGALELRSAETKLILLRDPMPPHLHTSPQQARAAVIAMQKQQARELYAPLFAELQLSVPQIEALTQLIAEHNTLTTSWSSGGVSFKPNAEDEQLARERLSQIELFLGPGGFEKFRACQETLPERFQLRRLVQVLNAVSHPLTSEQVTQLVSIMRDRREIRERPPRFSPGTLAHAEELVARIDEFDRTIQPRFESLLTSEQREAAAQYFTRRMERRHSALDAYRNLLSDGSRGAFMLPAD